VEQKGKAKEVKEELAEVAGRGPEEQDLREEAIRLSYRTCAIS
jgi:hypothetical protein